MMYKPFQQGTRSFLFGVRLRLVAERKWDHWDALRFALGCALRGPLAP